MVLKNYFFSFFFLSLSLSLCLCFSFSETANDCNDLLLNFIVHLIDCIKSCSIQLDHHFNCICRCCLFVIVIHWVGNDRLMLVVSLFLFLSMCAIVVTGEERVHSFPAGTVGGSATRTTFALGRGQTQSRRSQRLSLQKCRKHFAGRLLQVCSAILVGDPLAVCFAHFYS